jgi:anaerobic ribonucleoside-triphosphate reductase activating protein
MLAAEIYINKIHYPVKNLGAGTRLGIWFQGCPIRCKGCINPDTWDTGAGHKLAFSEFIKTLESFRDEKIDGITISGGEPFAQPGALYDLCVFLRTITPGDILVYSGYTYSRLSSKYRGILKVIDVLVSGPYIESKTDRLIWRGSDNQKITLLSEKAKKIYPASIDRTEWGARSMQFSIIGDSVYMVGIPARGDLDKLYRKMKEKGISCSRS